MNTATNDFHPGNLVRARNREWVVQAADNRLNDGSSLLRLHPLGGADEDIITMITALEFAAVEPGLPQLRSSMAAMPQLCSCVMLCG